MIDKRPCAKVSQTVDIGDVARGMIWFQYMEPDPVATHAFTYALLGATSINVPLSPELEAYWNRVDWEAIANA